MCEVDAGAVFVLPLRHGGFARGVVSAKAQAGVALYLFGPICESPDQVKELPLPRLGEEVYSGVCVPNALEEGKWSVVGVLPEAAGWPVPPHYAKGTRRGEYYVYTYERANLVRTETKERREGEMPPFAPGHGIMGWPGVEIKTSLLLRGGGEPAKEAGIEGGVRS